MRALIRSILSYAGSGYYHVRASRLVWWHILNAEARRRFRNNPVKLLPVGERIVRDLRNQGIAACHITELLPESVFLELARFAKIQWEKPEIQERTFQQSDILKKEEGGVKKPFLVNLWTGPAVLDLSHSFIKFSLSSQILSIVSAYLGLWAKFRGWRLEVTIPTPEGIRAKSSQVWHRDEEDIRLVKVFLYLNDVDEATGPFMYVRHSQADGPLANIFPMVPPRGSLKMPKEVEQYIPQNEVLKNVGKAGTIIFCDTTGLHKGGLTESKIRFMYTSIYTTAASPWRIRYTYPENFSAGTLSHEAQFAVENNPTQREPRFYR